MNAQTRVETQTATNGAIPSNAGPEQPRAVPRRRFQMVQLEERIAPCSNNLRLVVTVGQPAGIHPGETFDPFLQRVM